MSIRLYRYIINFIFTFSFITVYTQVWAQSPFGIWTWMWGDTSGTVSNDTGYYTKIGEYSEKNYPPAAYEPTYWADMVGNFWLLGGNDYAGFWEFNIRLNQWRCLHYSNGWNNIPNYGVQGVPSPVNYPAAPSFGAICWTDKQGDFWLYGGSYQGDESNNLWKYNIISNEWTWFKGNKRKYTLPIYKDQGIYSNLSDPGFRAEAKTGWVDDSNNLWLYGGYTSYDTSGPIRFYNDIWKYNPQLNEWMWVKGKYNSPNTHGAPYKESPSYMPSARASYSHWIDDSGYLYIFGGMDSSFLATNDLWRFNPRNSNWAWLSGHDQHFEHGFYKNYGNFKNKSLPCDRWENMCAQLKNCKNKLWLLGGFTHLKDTFNFERLNDLWYYDVIKRQWYWAQGDSFKVNKPYLGHKGKPDLKINVMAGGGEPIWVDNDDNMWVLTYFPDNYTPSILWRFTPFQTTDSVYNKVDIEICKDSSYTLNNGLKVKEPGIYFDTSITSNNCVQVTQFNTIRLSLKNTPPTFNKYYKVCNYDTVWLIADSITQGGYLWSTHDTLQRIKIAQPGIYTVAVLVPYCQPVYDTFTVLNKLCDSLIYLPAAFTPNGDGHNDVFKVLGEKGITIKNFKIYNRWGEQVFNSTQNGWDGTFNNQPQPHGTYINMIEYMIGDKTFFKKGDVELIR